MARTKKEAALTPEERLQAALVPDWERPYKLPENWCWTYLTKAAECLDNFRKPINATERAGRNGNVPYYGATGQVGWIDDFLTDEDLVLLGEDGAPFLDLIKDKAYLITGKAWVNNHAHILRSLFGDTGNRYLLHYLNSFNYAGYVNGTTRLKLTQASMDTIPIPLPPLAEQQRIVDRIKSLFAKLDEAKEKAQAVVDSFETRKAAILHKAFTGELTAKWREEHYATDNTVLMDIKNYSSSWSAKEKDLLSREQAKSEVVVLDNGHEWIRCTIGAVGRVTNGSTPLRKEPKYWSGKIPWISSGEVRNNIIESSNECISEEGYANSSVKLLPIGTVLIAMIGEGKTRGQSAILDIEATINQNVAAIVVEHNCVLPYYIWYWLQMNYAKNREKGSGSGPQALNCQRVRELDFFVPNLKEQKEVVNILRKALAKEQQSKEAAEAVLDQINLMKKSILARAFRGEMGTNDPSEESAVELLKQII
nr:restriction endonuclease subunit S [Ruminococcus bromii]